MPEDKYRTVRLLRSDVARIERALKGHPYLDGTSFTRWGHWISCMTGSEILAMAKKAGTRQLVEIQEHRDAGQPMSKNDLLTDEDDSGDFDKETDQ